MTERSLFRPFSMGRTNQTQASASHRVEAASVGIRKVNGKYISPFGEPMVLGRVGPASGPKVQALIDVKNRICVPVPEENR